MAKVVNGGESSATALWYVGPGRAELRPEAVPALKPGEARVRALHGAISRGTERLVLAGGVPESEFGRMRAPLMGGAFHSRRLRLVSSQVGKVAASHRARWTPRRRLAAALALLADPALDHLLAPATAFADLPEKLPGLLAPEGGALCPVIDY